MALPEFREGDFILTRSIVAMYGSDNGMVKITYKAPKGKMLVFMAVEVADMNEDLGAVSKRVTAKIKALAAEETDYPLIEAEMGTVVARI